MRELLHHLLDRSTAVANPESITGGRIQVLLYHGALTNARNEVISKTEYAEKEYTAIRFKKGTFHPQF